jgi:hypothetical protein
VENSRSIPILRNHDHNRDPIGFAKMTPAGLQVTFKDGEELTKEQFFKVFGDCAVRVEISVFQNGPFSAEFIKMATIACFSLGVPR